MDWFLADIKQYSNLDFKPKFSIYVHNSECIFPKTLEVIEITYDLILLEPQFTVDSRR